MITQRALGVLKPGVKATSPGERGTTAGCCCRVTLGLRSYLCLIWLEMQHCVHAVCAGGITGTATLQEFMLHFMK